MNNRDDWFDSNTNHLNYLKGFMELTEEHRIKLKELLDAGILTQQEYDYKVNPPEGFDTKKLVKGMFNAIDAVGWAKDFHSIFNIRKVIIYFVIIGAVFGFGYLRGNTNKPVHINNLNGKEAIIEIEKDKIYMHITKEGTIHLQDKNKKIIKQITVKDIPGLQKILMPIGIDIKPFATAGVGAGTLGDTGPEAGIGLSLFKFYRTHFDIFGTNKALYIGTDYRITDNFGILAGVGKSYDLQDTRVYIGGKWNF